MGSCGLMEFRPPNISRNLFRYSTGDAIQKDERIFCTMTEPPKHIRELVSESTMYELQYGPYSTSYSYYCYTFTSDDVDL